LASHQKGLIELMKFPLVITTLLASISLGAPSAALAQTQPAPTPQAPYTPQVVEGFVPNCIAGVMQQSPNIAPAIVNNYCRCIVSRMQAQVAEADFSEAIAGRQPQNERQVKGSAALKQSVQYCAKQSRTGNR
jgi:hypothetical protein